MAEYALRGMKKPIGISEYELTRALPKELQSSLPTIEQIEVELSAIGRGSSKGTATLTVLEAGKESDGGTMLP